MTGGSFGICKVVARFTDGRVLKGTIQDFAPNRPLFHLITDGPSAISVKIPVGALKALFFVKDFAGDPNRKDRNDFAERPAHARRLIVHFADGEKLAGTTTAFAPGCPGFFVVPADPEANNERVFVVRSAVKRVEWVSGVPAGVAKRL